MTITPFAGSGFWISTIIFTVIYLIALQLKTSVRFRNTLAIGTSVFIIYHTLELPGILLPLLALLTGTVYFFGNALLRKRDNKSSPFLSASMICLILLFLAYFKYSIVQELLDKFTASITGAVLRPEAHHLFFIGVSYFSFKFIHFLVDCRNGKIENPDFFIFFNYIFFFPSFFSGPINRYNSFSHSISAPPALASNSLEGIKRIINGLFKTIVLGNQLMPYSLVALNLETATWLQIIGGIYAYMLYIYFNFSGYSDMAIGLGKIVGIELPENFNYPFFKRNLQQFWANWHISLTSWLTDYIYWPLARKLRHKQTLKKRPVTLSIICIIITFLACGLWHGDGLNFILWGLYHGVGLAILNSYTYLVKKYASRNVKKFIHKSPLSYALSMFITVQYVALGFMLFAYDMQQLRTVTRLLIE